MIQDHTLFHEEPLIQEELDDGYTRPYRWHMDTPFYERLPGEVTILHSIRIPNVPDQRIKFPDGKEKVVGAGATACEFIEQMQIGPHTHQIQSFPALAFSRC